MDIFRRMGARRATLIALVVSFSAAAVIAPPSAGAAANVSWLKGFEAPETPASLNKVGVIKVGPRRAKNVLVLEPGTSGGAGYFLPFAKWAAAEAPGWQVWSVERRENLLEDQSMLTLAKERKVTAKQMFDYYLGYIVDPSVTTHFQPVPTAGVAFARQWGMRVAVEDLRHVIAAAKRRGGKVVLGGHSLGGAIVTAYATWNFAGRPGARALAGLVYDDGGSSDTSVTAEQATGSLQALQSASPWLAFSGIPSPYLGLFSATGAVAALIEPDGPALGQTFPLLPASLKPPLPATNLALFGYATDTKTSQLSFAAQAHLGYLDTATSPASWSNGGAISPIGRYARMLAGAGLRNADGTEWYFPQRLAIDTGAVNEGNANPAQEVLDVRATLGRHLPKRLRIYAFGAYGGVEVLNQAETLAHESHIPNRNLTLIDRQGKYAHNDPAAAFPHNAFFNNLLPFLRKIEPGRRAVAPRDRGDRNALPRSSKSRPEPRQTA
jgi:pimeloyl-ACP methyl ester carboxylesterase